MKLNLEDLKKVWAGIQLVGVPEIAFENIVAHAPSDLPVAFYPNPPRRR